MELKYPQHGSFELNHSHLTGSSLSKIRSWRFVFAIVHAGQNAHGLCAPCLFQDLISHASRQIAGKKHGKNHETKIHIHYGSTFHPWFIFPCPTVQLSNNDVGARTSRRSTPRWVGASAWGTLQNNDDDSIHKDVPTWTRCGNGAAVRVKLNALGSKSAFFVLIAVVELLFDLTKEHEHLHPETAVALHPKTEESQFGLEKSVSDAPQSLIFRLLNQDLNKKPWGTHCGTTNSNLFISSLVSQLAIQGADCYDLFAVAKNVSYALLTGQLCLLRVGQPRDGQIHRRGSIMFPECLKRFPA